MLKNYIFYLFIFLTLPFSSYCMNQKAKFAKGTIVRVVKGPDAYRNRVMIIKGTTEEVWGIESVYDDSNAINYNPLYRYFLTHKHHPMNGTVYYARYNDNLLKDCVHESWIEELKDFDKDDIVVASSSELDGKGGWITTYQTMRDMKEALADKEKAK